MDVASYHRCLVALFMCCGAAVLVIVNGQPTIDDADNDHMSSSVLDKFCELVMMCVETAVLIKINTMASHIS